MAGHSLPYRLDAAELGTSPTPPRIAPTWSPGRRNRNPAHQRSHRWHVSSRATTADPSLLRALMGPAAAYRPAISSTVLTARICEYAWTYLVRSPATFDPPLAPGEAAPRDTHRDRETEAMSTSARTSCLLLQRDELISSRSDFTPLSH